jgi:SulP family sulfate permease
MLLDFKNVSGIDSSSTLSFVKMRQLAEQNGFTLIFTQLSPEIERLLAKESFDTAPKEVFRTFIDLDHGLEWSENQILHEEGIVAAEYDGITFRDQMKEAFADSGEIDKLLTYFERMEVKQGDYLMHQNDPSDSLYLIEKGLVTAKLIIGSNDIVRLRTMCAGTIVGELGLILDEPRSASVVAEHDTTVYRLSAKSLKEMRAKDPQIAVAFHQFLTVLLAERLTNTGRTIKTLLE